MGRPEGAPLKQVPPRRSMTSAPAGRRLLETHQDRRASARNVFGPATLTWPDGTRDEVAEAIFIRTPPPYPRDCAAGLRRPCLN